MPQPNAPRPLPKLAQALVKSLLVGLYILLVFLAVYRFQSKLAMASLAASAFIAFAFPHSDSSRAGHMLGGYACGVVLGAACCFLRRLLPPTQAADNGTAVLFCALAVFLTAFCMIMLSCQHPPAAALAVSMVLEPDPLPMGLSVMVCILVLAGLRLLLLKWLGKYLSPD
ncbi:MAG: HPP family protein [Ruminococcaceae bacterium]|nr:HPP family protein [Oscillospiraceae bacterium]